MIDFIAIGLLVGGLLGARFTVGALIPATALIVSVAALASAGPAGAAHWSVFQVVALVVFLQIGYVCGAGLRLFVAPLRVPRQGKALRTTR
jgi:hypothetical protein